MTLNHATLKAKLSNHTGTRFLLPINSPLYLITPASPTTSIQFQRFLHPKNHNRTIRNFTKLRPIPDLFLDQRDVIKNVCYIWEREREIDNDRVEKNFEKKTCLNDRSVWTWTKEIVGWCRSLARFWSRSRFNVGSRCLPERFTGQRSPASFSAIWLLSLSASFHLGIIKVATVWISRWNSGSINRCNDHWCVNPSKLIGNVAEFLAKLCKTWFYVTE